MSTINEVVTDLASRVNGKKTRIIADALTEVAGEDWRWIHRSRLSRQPSPVDTYSLDGVPFIEFLPPCLDEFHGEVTYVIRYRRLR